jgi:hypothetical protein
MVRAHLAGAGFALAALGACSGGDHAPLIAIAPGAGGKSSGGKTGAGVAPGVDAGTGGGSDTEGAGGDGENAGGFGPFGAGGKKTGAGGKHVGAGGSSPFGPADAGMPVDPPPWALTTLDQTDVYIFGQLTNAACDNYAMARFYEPDKYTMGFECSGIPSKPMISRGRLYYQLPMDPHLHQFVPDLVEPYPQQPYANDKSFDTPCASGILAGFLFSPSGDFLYHCYNDGWFEYGGIPVYPTNDNFTAMADGRLMATPGVDGSWINAGVMSLSDHVLRPIMEMSNNKIGFRAHGKAIHYVVPGAPSSLWSVDAETAPQKLFDYGPRPPRVEQVSPRPFLAPDDSIIDFGFDVDDIHLSYSFRLNPDGTSEIIGSSNDPPHGGLHGGTFITGP